MVASDILSLGANIFEFRRMTSNYAMPIEVYAIFDVFERSRNKQNSIDGRTYFYFISQVAVHLILILIARTSSSGLHRLRTKEKQQYSANNFSPDKTRMYHCSVRQVSFQKYTFLENKVQSFRFPSLRDVQTDIWIETAVLGTQRTGVTASDFQIT